MRISCILSVPCSFTAVNSWQQQQQVMFSQFGCTVHIIWVYILTPSVRQPSDAIIMEYCIPSDLTWKLTASLQLKILATVMHFAIRNVIYILKIEYSTSNVDRIYFIFIIINLTNMSFTISMMSEYTAAVSCRFASVGNVYKVYYHCHYLLTMIVTGYTQQITSLIL